MRKILLNIQLTSVLSPEQLQALISKVAEIISAGGQEPVIISGRLPVWVYGALVHYFHPRPYVATFDPRLGAGVVVASHTPSFREGDLVSIEDTEKISITFP